MNLVGADQVVAQPMLWDINSRLEHSFDPFKLEGMKWGQPGEEDPFQIKRPIDYFRLFCAWLI